MHFSVEFHHMGLFVNDPTPHYEGGEVHVVHNLDLDKWSYSEALRVVKKEFGYFGKIKMWWKTKESGFENGVKLINEDSHALELANCALENKCEVEVYIEHDVSLPGDVEEVLLLTGGDDSNVGGMESEGKDVCDVVEDKIAEMGDGSVEDIQFDDSKERVVEVYDGFDDLSCGDKCEKISRKRKDVPVKRPVGLRRKLSKRNAKMGGTVRVDGDGGQSENTGEIHELEEEYHTKKLESGGSDSESDEDSKPKYIRFNKENMSKDFEFKLGMEFASLQEFKEAIIEHSILNGREIKFLKNDAIRVRVRCKHACNFVAFVSKDGYGNTFRMKTLVPKHTCERVFNNKIAKSKWVTKVVADKFLISDNMKVNDIVEEIRSSYAIEISPSRARRAKQIAKGMRTALSQLPHQQDGKSTTDPGTLTTVKEKPATGQKRGKRKVAATGGKDTQMSHVSAILQEEGPTDEGPIALIAHTEVVQMVEPLSYYKYDESDGPIDGVLDSTTEKDGRHD